MDFDQREPCAKEVGLVAGIHEMGLALTLVSLQNERVRTPKEECSSHGESVDALRKGHALKTVAPARFDDMGYHSSFLEELPNPGDRIAFKVLKRTEWGWFNVAYVSSGRQLRSKEGAHGQDTECGPQGVPRMAGVSFGFHTKSGTLKKHRSMRARAQTSGMSVVGYLKSRLRHDDMRRMCKRHVALL